MEGFTHRISAAALQSRRLVRITGHGPTWRAEITPSGTAFLERLATGGADQRSSDTTANRNDSRPAIRARLNGNATQPAPPARQPKPRSLSPTDQLIADLIAAGGILRVPYWRKEGEPDYRQRVIAAQRFGKVPPGKRLVTDHVQGGELEIRLEDALPGTDIVAQAVPVPARLTRPHSVAARYREDTDNHQVSRAALPRSVRIVHAVVTEAERRGHKVANPRSPVRDRSARDSAKELVPHVVITVGNHAYSLNMSEEKVLLRGVWEERKRQEERYRLQFPYGIHERLKPYDSEATGSLSISLLAPGARREGPCSDMERPQVVETR